MDVAVVGGETKSSVGFGGGDEDSGFVSLAAVDVDERRGRLEVGTGQAGVGVWAVLLGWPSAVAVGQARLDPGHVVFGPFGISGHARRVVGDVFAGEVDSLLAVLVEGPPDGGVVQGGVAGGHLRAGVAEEALDDVLGDALVDEPGYVRGCDETGGRLPGPVGLTRRARRWRLASG